MILKAAFLAACVTVHYCTIWLAVVIYTLGPAIPIVAISAGIVHRHYGTDD